MTSTTRNLVCIFIVAVAGGSVGIGYLDSGLISSNSSALIYAWKFAVGLAVALLIFGFGGFLGTVPSVLFQRQVVDQHERDKVINLAIFGLSIIVSGITLAVCMMLAIK